MQGIQPKSNNNGKAQMFVILLASMCNGTSEANLYCVFVALEFGSFLSENCEGVGGG